jgi:hypothetical protein
MVVLADSGLSENKLDFLGESSNKLGLSSNGRSYSKLGVLILSTGSDSSSADFYTNTDVPGLFLNCLYLSLLGVNSLVSDVCCSFSFVCEAELLLFRHCDICLRRGKNPGCYLFGVEELLRGRTGLYFSFGELIKLFLSSNTIVLAFSASCSTYFCLFSCVIANTEASKIPLTHRFASSSCLTPNMILSWANI